MPALDYKDVIMGSGCKSLIRMFANMTPVEVSGVIDEGVTVANLGELFASNDLRWIHTISNDDHAVAALSGLKKLGLPFDVVILDKQIPSIYYGNNGYFEPFDDGPVGDGYFIDKLGDTSIDDFALSHGLKKAEDSEETNLFVKALKFAQENISEQKRGNCYIASIFGMLKLKFYLERIIFNQEKFNGQSIEHQERLFEEYWGEAKEQAQKLKNEVYFKILNKLKQNFSNMSDFEKVQLWSVLLVIEDLGYEKKGKEASWFNQGQKDELTAICDELIENFTKDFKKVEEVDYPCDYVEDELHALEILLARFPNIKKINGLHLLEPGKDAFIAYKDLLVEDYKTKMAEATFLGKETRGILPTTTNNKHLDVAVRIVCLYLDGSDLSGKPPLASRGDPLDYDISLFRCRPRSSHALGEKDSKRKADADADGVVACTFADSCGRSKKRAKKEVGVTA